MSAPLGYESDASGNVTRVTGHTVSKEDVKNSNVQVGYQTLYYQTSGTENTACGHQAGYWNTSGDQNVFFGSLAGGIYPGLSAQTPYPINYCSFLGAHAGMFHSVGDYNTAVGCSAMRGSLPSLIAPAVNTNDSNTALGVEALNECFFASWSCAFGRDAGKCAGNSQYNTYLGGQSGFCLAQYELQNATFNNCGVGYWTLRQFPLAQVPATFNNCVAMGYKAMSAVSGANKFCTAVGANALTNTTGDNASAFGANALLNLTSGINNVGVGFGAGATIMTGDSNTILGAGADVNSPTRSGCIVLGAGAVATADAQLVLASTAAPLTTQASAGAAGLAAPTPASPALYLPVLLNGIKYVVPLFAAQ